MNLNPTDLRMNTQAFLLTGGFLILAFINFFTLRYYKNDVEKDALIIKSATENKWAYEKINHYLRRYKDGEEKLEFPISQLASTYSSTIETLNIGGILPKSQVYIDPLAGDVRYSVEKINMYWGQQLALLNNFLYPTSLSDSSTTDQLTPEASYRNFMLNSEYFERTNEELLTGLITSHLEKQDKFDNALIFFLIFNVIFVGLVIFIVKNHFFNPLEELSELSEKVSQGELSEKSLYEKKNEFGDISKALNILIDNLRSATTFVKEIGEGNLDKEFEGIDRDAVKEGSLAASLLQMRSEMQQMEITEEQRNWATEGLARFVDILRSTDSNVQTLSSTIISSLIDYTKSNQGAIYLINEEDKDDKFLELVALYAFDTQKFEEKKIRLGEGLVGQTFLEQKTTYILEIPHEYITIVSGLGGANPKAILLVPLMVNEEIYGVIELASFNEYKTHEIEFVEKLAESIASTIASVKNNELTRHLLEESQELTEQMQAQEEEMRQNMEELTATQEEMNRKARETEKLLEESQKRTQYIEVLAQIAKYDYHDRDSFLSYVINVIGELLNWPVAHVYFTKKEDDNVILIPSTIWKGDDSQEFRYFKTATEKHKFEPGIGLPGRIYNEKASHWINDIVKDPNFPRAKNALALDLHSAFGTPIMVNDEVVGVVEFFTKKAIDSDKNLLEFMDQVGDLMGSVIKRLEKIGDNEELSSLQEVEEELRQNLEALEITQNQLNDKFQHATAQLSLMNNSVATITCDERGNIIEVNTPALISLGLEANQATGKNIKEFINNYDTNFLVSEGVKSVELKETTDKSVNLSLKIQFGEIIDTKERIIYLIWLQS